MAGNFRYRSSTCCCGDGDGGGEDAPGVVGGRDTAGRDVGVGAAVLDGASEDLVGLVVVLVLVVVAVVLFRRAPERMLRRLRFVAAVELLELPPSVRGLFLLRSGLFDATETRSASLGAVDAIFLFQGLR
jgi:hypothetical protein